MRRRTRRMIMIGAAGVTLALASALVLSALSQKITYFYGPSELVAMDAPPSGSIRLGGLVEDDSVVRGQGLVVRFRVTDGAASVPVAYEGSLPDLFREGQGVVTEGIYDADGTFEAFEVLAKHDETYMPREVVEALQRSGEWRGSDLPESGLPESGLPEQEEPDDQ